jgi:hypothetical protein
MRHLLCAAVALAIVAARPATAGDVQSKPIDTKSLLIQPSKTAANLAAATIEMAGKSAADTVEKDGFVKTFNNLFRKPTLPTLQAGPSKLPAPTLFPSTQYKSFNTPMKPIAMPSRR